MWDAVCSGVVRCAVLAFCRNFSARDEARCDCDTLQQVLESLPGARRMVVSAQHGQLSLV
jgi:hypothetical protein